MRGRPTGYSNWELASDRANAARRLLHAYGVRPEQVVEVRGFADQRPFNDQDRNRRAKPPGFGGGAVYSLKSSRRRRVCTRLTGTSVCFLSSMRSW